MAKATKTSKASKEVELQPSARSKFFNSGSNLIPVSGATFRCDIPEASLLGRGYNLVVQTNHELDRTHETIPTVSTTTSITPMTFLVVDELGVSILASAGVPIALEEEEADEEGGLTGAEYLKLVARGGNKAFIVKDDDQKGLYYAYVPDVKGGVQLTYAVDLADTPYFLKRTKKSKNAAIINKAIEKISHAVRQIGGLSNTRRESMSQDEAGVDLNALSATTPPAVIQPNSTMQHEQQSIYAAQIGVLRDEIERQYDWLAERVVAKSSTDNISATEDQLVKLIGPKAVKNLKENISDEEATTLFG